MIVGIDKAVSDLDDSTPSLAGLHTSQSRGADGMWNFFASISLGAIFVTSNPQATPMMATTDAIDQFKRASKVAADRLALLSPDTTRNVLDASNLG